MKPILVITHERSGTHLLINLINYEKNGEFFTIGYIPNTLKIEFNKINYKHQTYKDIIINSYRENSVSKSHHQVDFMEDYLDFIFEKYNVIYVKRDIKDVLVSYYNFLLVSNDTLNLPKFEDWIFMKPDDVARKCFSPYYPDPHILIEPENYIHRYKCHIDGWMKYKEKILFINYEDILLDFTVQKEKIESYISKKISNKIPDINDKNLPNFNPGKGIIGSHKEYMSEELINKINNF